MNKFVQMWYLLHFCVSLVTLVNPFFRPVQIMAHSFKSLKSVREKERVIETFFFGGGGESICLCKFNSSPTKNERKRMINVAFAS